MVNHAELIARDVAHLWHPCTQMKDFERDPPLIVFEAKDSYLFTDRGPIIDATASWWCKSLGHGHPAITAAMKDQLTRFDHIIGANTVNPMLVELCEELSQLSGLQHVFFASDGSSAVEIAMKLALQSAILKGQPHRNQFIALQSGYHGETLATSSVSNVCEYKSDRNDSGIICHFLQHIPYVTHTDDPLWTNSAAEWLLAEKELNTYKENACALILEPLIQGSGGMRLYSRDFLKRLERWASQNNIYLIADEIMTGMGRTGEWLACHHAGIKPSMICLSKGLTAGTVPMSCVLIEHEIYELFYRDYHQGISFLHSNTFSGNALGVSAALATIKTIRSENILQQTKELETSMLGHFLDIAQRTKKIQNVRAFGGLVAGELIGPHHQRIGYQVQQEAMGLGALFRPLGNTLYWLPPLNIKQETIEKLAEITLNSIENVYARLGIE